MGEPPRASDASWFTPYMRALEVAKVPDERRRRHVRWVGRHADSLDGKELHTTGRADAEDFISSLPVGEPIEDWQFRQAADVPRILVTSSLVKPWWHWTDGPGDGGSGR